MLSIFMTEMKKLTRELRALIREVISHSCSPSDTAVLSVLKRSKTVDSEGGDASEIPKRWKIARVTSVSAVTSGPRDKSACVRVVPFGRLKRGCQTTELVGQRK
jgi:hypothetical protein